MLVAFGRVVVDHVQHHFQSLCMQVLDHLTEFGRDGCRVVRLRCQARIRATKAQRVVAPVIALPALRQGRLIQAILHRQQRQRGHPQRLEVGHGRRMRQRRISSLQGFRNTGMGFAEALDVDFIEHQIGHRVTRCVQVTRRDTEGCGNACLECGGGVLLRVALIATNDLAGVRVQQQVPGVEALTLLRIVNTVRAQTVNQTRAGASQKAVKNTVVRTRQLVALYLGLAVGIKQAQLDALRMQRKDRKIDAAVAHLGAHRFRPTF